MHLEHPPQTRQSRAQRTIPHLPRLLPRRLTALATTLVVCGSFAALPDTQPTQDMSTVTSAAVTAVSAPESHDPAFPELMGTQSGPAGAAPSLTSSTSLFTSASLIARFAEEAGTSTQEGVGQSPGPLRPRGRYQWPTGAPATVVEAFDPPAVVWGRGHRGVDLAAAEGAQIRSAAAGTVVFAGMVAGRPVVSVDHGDGIRTTYEPVEPNVSAGEAVGAGQVIGTLLPGHRSDGVCALHWGARTGPKTYINPLRLLQPAVIRLKPVRESR